MLCGCDVGASSVKLVVMEEATEKILFAHRERIGRRSPAEAVETVFAKAAKGGFQKKHFSYIAATGEAEAVGDRKGRFYSMTCHARGARFFSPQARSVLDMGALHMRAMNLDEKGRVMAYRMTSQCASGTGQFLENIARRLGLPLDEFSQLSLLSQNPHALSTICVVLAETDIINMVSKGAVLADIIRSVHDFIAKRAVTLLSTLVIKSPLVLTGGMALDLGLVRSLEREFSTHGGAITLEMHEMSVYAGAIGAALWGGVRRRKLADRTSI